MIKASFDEGFIFDCLSILEVKVNKASGENHLKILLSYKAMKEEILSQVGEALFSLILSSKQYKDLYNINEHVFNLVNLAKDDKVKASEVDKANYDRYLIKTALNKKFFNKTNTEIKIGYST
jgi:hypothetical protein